MVGDALDGAFLPPRSPGAVVIECHSPMNEGERARSGAAPSGVFGRKRQEHMKIVFLNPPFKGRFSRASRSPAVTKGGTLYYPIWLAYAAGVAEQTGHEVLLLDAPARGWDASQTHRLIAAFAPGLVVVDTSTPSIYADAAFAAAVKTHTPGAHVSLVGTHPSALPEESLQLDARLDSICLGEYDYTVRDLAAALEADDALHAVQGLVFRERRHGGATTSIIRNAERERIDALDALPFVSAVYKRHLRPKDYFFAAAAYPMVMIITGRGCPFRCFFCVYPQVFHGRRYRGRSPENVAAEFAYIAQEFPEVREIGVEDDCFTADKPRARRICELLVAQCNALPWYCNVRGDLDEDLLRLMKQAGCRLVTVGFESGDEAILKAMRKGETVSQYRRFVKAARKVGVLVHGCIMTGNPGETPETLAASYKFATAMNCDSMQFYPLYVYPGTEAYAWAKDAGYLSTEAYDQWLTPEGLHDCVLNLPDYPGAEMMRLCDMYLQRYHLRPAYLVHKLAQAVRHPREGYRSLKSGKTLLVKMLRGQMGRSR